MFVKCLFFPLACLSAFTSLFNPFQAFSYKMFFFRTMSLNYTNANIADVRAHNYLTLSSAVTSVWRGRRVPTSSSAAAKATCAMRSFCMPPRCSLTAISTTPPPSVCIVQRMHTGKDTVVCSRTSAATPQLSLCSPARILHLSNN